eukprot:CAMPEP_0198131162 /NCGR_PEP_ID=MMETSP1442-20131203/55538_1 /TAXON_ID= /ORGANISM="Craspedostauros australis, Strain CCMP3328" /LENGTH=243 /DNA_ID=CAMNT_0043791919 /DNA_START=73 /DNA_END=804 /DNA_ORIENTATION=-
MKHEFQLVVALLCSSLLVLLESLPPVVAAASTTAPTVIAFAAKKGSKKKKKSTASTIRGFGAAPPTHAEVLDSLRTRFTTDDLSKPCPCGSGETYEACCRPFHLGEQTCQRSMDVLKSRYSAFRFRNIGYVQRTTHPECRDFTTDKVAWAKSLDKEGMFDSYDFVKLNVLSDEEAGKDENESYVAFEVVLRAMQRLAEDGLEGKETVISEKSRFLKDLTDGSWSYAGGEVRSGESGLEDTVLN